MLLSVAALNMPQAAVFCIGDDGHMAIEPAGHDHCADGSHPRNYHPTGDEAAEHSHIGLSQCRPCVDIPIPTESSDRRFVSRRLRFDPARAEGFVPAVQTPWSVEAFTVAELPSFLPVFGGVPPQRVVRQV